MWMRLFVKCRALNFSHRTSWIVSMRREWRCSCLCHNIGWSLNNSFALFHTFKCELSPVRYSIFSTDADKHTHTTTVTKILSLAIFFLPLMQTKVMLFFVFVSLFDNALWMYVDYFTNWLRSNFVYTLRN